MKKSVGLGLMIGMIFFGIAVAQTAQNREKHEDAILPMFIINMSKVMKESTEGKKAASQIQTTPGASQQKLAESIDQKIQAEGLALKMRNDLKRIAKDIGAKNHLGTIFDLDKSGIVYSDASMDLTETVILIYNGNESHSPLSANAQKMAFINSQRVLEESIEGKKAIAQIQKAPSASQRETANRLFLKIQDELMPIVNDIGSKNKIGAIFDIASSGIVYCHPSLDITDIIIKRYNGTSSSMSLNIDPYKIAVVSSERVLAESMEGKKVTSQIQVTPDADKAATSNRLYEKMQGDLFPLVKDIGVKNGYGVIFDLGKAGIAYFDPSIDITDGLIARYDQRK